MKYPPDHAVALARVLRVIEIIADRFDISNEELVEQLVSEGIDRVDAFLLMAFVPTALSYPIVVSMGASDLPWYYMVGKRPGSRRSVLLPLKEEHYFTAALQWVTELLQMDPAERPITLEAFNAVVVRSPVLDAANRMLENYGRDALRSGVFAPLVINGVTAEEIEASRRAFRPRRRWWQFWRR
ncbi:MAG: hypothetical protein N3E46_03095 [Gemmataceae bacterium]|nr:hypothetical protein [Gemmataceae bacterium]